MKFWLIKQEPTKYNWEKLVEDKETVWDGVRNYQARNNLQAMKKGDMLLFYHSVVGKEVKGIATVSKESYQDPTSDDARWLAVSIKPVKKLNNPVSLDNIKVHAGLQSIALIKQSRLSVLPLTRDEFNTILAMGRTSSI
jgi:predicted RNA-binding protein with PUA-like domain